MECGVGVTNKKKKNNNTAPSSSSSSSNKKVKWNEKWTVTAHTTLLINICCWILHLCFCFSFAFYAIWPYIAFYCIPTTFRAYVLDAHAIHSFLRWLFGTHTQHPHRRCTDAWFVSLAACCCCLDYLLFVFTLCVWVRVRARFCVCIVFHCRNEICKIRANLINMRRMRMKQWTEQSNQRGDKENTFSILTTNFSFSRLRLHVRDSCTVHTCDCVWVRR